MPNALSAVEIGSGVEGSPRRDAPQKHWIPFPLFIQSLKKLAITDIVNNIQTLEIVKPTTMNVDKNSEEGERLPSPTFQACTGAYEFFNV